MTNASKDRYMTIHLTFLIHSHGFCPVVDDLKKIKNMKINYKPSYRSYCLVLFQKIKNLITNVQECA